MEEERHSYQEDDISVIVERYERMRKNNENYFFDVVEFESIIDYYLENNDVSFAFEAAESAYIQHPQSVSLQLRRAKVLIDKGRAVDALKNVKIIESLEPGNFEVFLIKGAALGMLGDIKGARKNFDHALTLDDSEEVAILLSITSILYNLNHYKILLPYLHSLIELEPDFYTHLYDLAYAYEKLDRYEEAIDFYQHFLDKAPFSDSGWYNLGILYNKTNRLKEAVEAYDYALAVNPDNIFALFNKGNILSSMGEYPQALEVYLEYLEQETESSEALTYAGECYDRTGDREMAGRYYQEAIDLDPGFSEPWYGMGVIYLRDNMIDEAIHYFRKSVELEQDNPEYHYYLGMALAAGSQQKEGARSFMQALKMDPFYDIVWNDLGRLIVSEGMYFKVVSILEKALKITGDVHGLRYVLASSYLYCGEADKCYHNLSKAFVMSEDSFKIFRELFPDHLLSEDIKQLLLLKD